MELAMKWSICRWTAGVALAVGLNAVVSPAFVRGDAEEEEQKKNTLAARADLLKLSGLKGAALKKAAEELAKKHQMEFVMYAFKPRSKNGIGMGDPKDKITPDCIELYLLQKLGKSKQQALTLEKQRDALIKMAQVTGDIAEVTEFYKPKKNLPGKSIADWEKFTKEMQEGSKDLMKALDDKKPDATKVFNAAQRLNSSCVDCHAAFRDSK
jgi:hypothetical protein